VAAFCKLHVDVEAARGEGGEGGEGGQLAGGLAPLSTLYGREDGIGPYCPPSTRAWSSTPTPHPSDRKEFLFRLESLPGERDDSSPSHRGEGDFDDAASDASCRSNELSPDSWHRSSWWSEGMGPIRTVKVLNMSPRLPKGQRLTGHINLEKLGAVLIGLGPAPAMVRAMQLRSQPKAKAALTRRAAPAPAAPAQMSRAARAALQTALASSVPKLVIDDPVNPG
jgi:hypothetical protein